VKRKASEPEPQSRLSIEQAVLALDGVNPYAGSRRLYDLFCDGLVDLWRQPKVGGLWVRESPQVIQRHLFIDVTEGPDGRCIKLNVQEEGSAPLTLAGPKPKVIPNFHQYDWAVPERQIRSHKERQRHAGGTPPTHPPKLREEILATVAILVASREFKTATELREAVAERLDLDSNKGDPDPDSTWFKDLVDPVFRLIKQKS
jgi:hypothetical protein